MQILVFKDLMESVNLLINVKISVVIKHQLLIRLILIVKHFFQHVLPMEMVALKSKDVKMLLWKKLVKSMQIRQNVLG